MPGDASGVEPLEGESEAEYVARQTRLREEAAERMRQKFGASGGLNGGVRMGGVGSSPNYGSSGSSASELLSSAASGASWLFGKAADKASNLRSGAGELLSSARDAYSERQTFEATRDSRGFGGGFGAEEGSRDLSDLLGKASFDDAPVARKPTSPSPMPSRTPPLPRPQSAEDFFAEALADAAPSKAAPIGMPTAPVASAPVVSMHYGGAAGATPTRRKVAATKVAKDDKWDDWGDDKW